MRKFIAILMMFATLSAVADERGEKRLETISRYYSSLGRYSVSFVMRVGNEQHNGVMVVDGKNSYMKAADMEVFITDSLRYEVRGDVKEIILDRADVYEKELLNSLNGLSHIATDYTIEESVENGCVALRLTPKKSGETIYVVTTPDGKSVAKLQYGAGENRVDISVKSCQTTTQRVPIFSKEEYKGFELIDFR